MAQAKKQKRGYVDLPGSVEVKRISIDKITYVLRMIPCGKKRCKSCPHGPYWYARFSSKGVPRQVYIGKPPFKTLAEFNEIEKRKREEKRLEREAKERLNGSVS